LAGLGKPRLSSAKTFFLSFSFSFFLLVPCQAITAEPSPRFPLV
jgi:hypothetical protein